MARKKDGPKQGHHMICISIFGPNYVENIMDITPKEHELIHSSLDISYKLIRSFKMRTNHLLLTPNEYYVREIMRLHQMYFARLPHLPDRLQQLHAECMQLVALRYRKENGFPPVSDTQHGTWFHMFIYWLGVYHDTMLEIVKK